MSDDALTAIAAVDFDWTKHLQSIWLDDPSDVPDVQRQARALLTQRIEQLSRAAEDASPVGQPLIGPAGAGKTHLLGTLRSEVHRCHGTFVLVDLSTVRDFWETVLLGYFQSLMAMGPTGATQVQQLLDHLIVRFGDKVGPEITAESIRGANPTSLVAQSNRLLSAISQLDRDAALQHQDVVRALLMLLNDDFEVQNIGYSWLQGGDPLEDATVTHGLRRAADSPEATVTGLSWLLSLRGPTVLAFDQLDAVVPAHHAAVELEDDARGPLARALLRSVGGGLMALRDLTRRTLTVVCAIEATWTVLQENNISSVMGRFGHNVEMPALTSGEVARQVVEQRLQRAYADVGFAAPYPSWPFRPEAFETASGLYVRDMLRAGDQHLKKCLRRGRIDEFASFELRVDTETEPGLDLKRFDEALDAARKSVNVAQLLDERDERRQDHVLEALADCLVRESRGTYRGEYVQRNFTSNRNFDPLHVSVKVPGPHGQDKGRALGLRFLQSQNAVAFQARIRAAMTESGIDLGMADRRLILFRVGDPPGGSVTEKLLNDFRRKGGVLASPIESELRTMAALTSMVEEYGIENRDFGAWLVTRRPASTLPFFGDVGAWLASHASVPAPALNSPPTPTPPPPPAAPPPAPPPEASTEPRSVAKASAGIPLGRRWDAGELGAELLLPQLELANHMVVLAGSGSGKTVFVKRLIEESALKGIPSIVIDGANDLARLGDRWPAGEGPKDTDSLRKLEPYFADTEVVVYTPGRSAGRSLDLQPLPISARFSITKTST